MSKTLQLVPLASSDAPPPARAGALRDAAFRWSPLGDGAVLVLGAADGLRPRLAARPGGPGSRPVSYEPQSWTRAAGEGGGGATGCAALLHPPAPGQRIGAVVLATSAGQVPVRLARSPLALPALVDALAEDAAGAFPDVVEGLIDTALRELPAAAAARLGAALLASARPCGFIEIVAPLADATFVQGWSSELPAGRTPLLLADDTLATLALQAATFARSDLDEHAHGFLGLLDRPGLVRNVRRLFFRGRGGWRSLEMYDRHLVLAQTDVPAYMRDGLGRAAAPAGTLDCLREVAGRFDGRDTVSTLDRPIRVGIDFTARGGGTLVVGWLLDPDHAVRSVTLRQGTGAARLDETWTRVTRADVTKAFAGERAFGGLRGDPAHGFVAFAPGLGASEGAYLDLDLGGERVFYPLPPAAAPLRPSLERLLGLLDPHAPSTAFVIGRQVAPALAAAAGPGPRIVRTVECGRAHAEGPLALVVGLGREGEDVTALVTALAIDREARALPIAIAAPAERHDEIGGTIRRLAEFYDLSLRLVLAEGVEDECDALDAGIRGCTAGTLVLLSGSAQPRSRGWLGRLHDAFLKEGGGCVVCPTLLFEDDAIRWAGTWLDADRVCERLVGYPLDALSGATRTRVVAGTAQCCIVSRRAYDGVDGFSRGYFTAGQKSVDLCLRLGLAGTPSLWVPEVSVYLTEDARPGLSPIAAQHARQADRLGFERRWSAQLAALGE